MVNICRPWVWSLQLLNLATVVPKQPYTLCKQMNVPRLVWNSWIWPVVVGFGTQAVVADPWPTASNVSLHLMSVILNPKYLTPPSPTDQDRVHKY